MDSDFQLTISIPTDDEGYSLLQCEHCGTHFKATPYDIHDDGVLNIFCPSCGLISNSYITDDVLELAEKMTNNILNDMIYDMIYDMFKDLERHSKRGVLQFKAGRRPMHEAEDPIRSGIEALEICLFPCCNRTVKIKPILKMTGAYCPFCGVKNYEVK